MMCNFPKTGFAFWIIWFSLYVCLSAQQTVVQGKVIDARSGEAVAAATVRMDGVNAGAISDSTGSFRFSTREKGASVSISCLGYESIQLKIIPGQINTLEVKLTESGVAIKEIEIVAKAKKYRNKDNPAVEFIREVLSHKSQNKKENLEYYSLERYDKIQFALNNIGSRFRSNPLFRKTQFIFDNLDTNQVTGQVNLPFYLRETLSDVYYRKSPSTWREYIRGEKSTRLPGYIDDDGISNMVENLYREIDFYKNAVNLVTVDFVSPLADFAPNIYEYYLRDTSLLDNTMCVHVQFVPRQKNDLAFNGDMWIAFDSTFALRKIEVEVPDGINLNWVNDLQVQQTFEWVAYPDGRALLPQSDMVKMEFGFAKGDHFQTILAQKSSSCSKYSINQPVAESLLKSGVKVQRDSGAIYRDEAFWQAHRHDTLNRHEAGVYHMIDSLQGNVAFKRFMGAMRIFIDGYFPYNKLDIGPTGAFIGFNPVEGLRLRFGGRTNLKFSKRLMPEAYAAYGLRDKRFKGMAGLRYSFGDDEVNKYPLHQIRVAYLNDLQLPGQDVQNNLWTSLQRGNNDKMLYAQSAYVQCLEEWKNGFSYSVSYRLGMQQPAGSLRFDYLSPDGIAQRKSLTTNELGFMFRYAPNEKFYQSGDVRLYAFNKYPTIQAWYTAGLKGVMGGEYSYHTLRTRISKGFYFSPIGWSTATVEAGRTFGQLPFTLLVVHPANQTLAFSDESYNLLNNFEFVSDKYASIQWSHYFGGFIFNRIPGLRWLKLREVVTCKALWGGLDARNQPTSENALLLFPENEQGQPLTHMLGKKPYMEASFGIMNILKVLRVDFVYRLTYLDLPEVRPFSVRARFQVEF